LHKTGTGAQVMRHRKQSPTFNRLRLGDPDRLLSILSVAEAAKGSATTTARARMACGVRPVQFNNERSSVGRVLIASKF